MTDGDHGRPRSSRPGPDEPTATPAVAAACGILGIDPRYVANEGTLVAAVASEAVQAAPGQEGLVLLDTALGGSRARNIMAGDPLPRIC